jgi:serine/threonine protein phosphatase PrpC
MLTGLLPFQAIVRSRGAMLPPPSELNPSLPPAADAVIFRAIEPDPTKRYDSALAFAVALNAALQSVPKSVTPTRLATTGNANIIVRTIIPENPCNACGQENRSSSRFCRRCGHRLDDTSPLVTDVCQVGYVSDTGRRYATQVNEDMLLIVQGLCANLAPPPRPFGLFAVADGLRGPQGKSVAGHEASRLAIETVADVLLPLLATSLPSNSYSTPGNSSSVSRRSIQGNVYQSPAPPDTILEQWMGEATRRANLVTYHCNADYETSMGSTLTVALVHKRHLYVTSIGDSRAYHYRSSSKDLKCITTDHTLVANLAQANLPAFDEERISPKDKRLYRYLGQDNRIQIDYFHHPVELNDLVLLCTNGLWHMLRDAHINEILAQGGDPQKIARILVDEANLAGGDGNVSAIVVGIQ